MCISTANIAMNTIFSDCLRPFANTIKYYPLGKSTTTVCIQPGKLDIEISEVVGIRRQRNRTCDTRVNVYPFISHPKEDNSPKTKTKTIKQIMKKAHTTLFCSVLTF